MRSLPHDFGVGPPRGAAGRRHRDRGDELVLGDGGPTRRRPKVTSQVVVPPAPPLAPVPVMRMLSGTWRSRFCANLSGDRPGVMGNRCASTSCDEPSEEEGASSTAAPPGAASQAG
ncbi:MAG TPA: hypothetical protein VMU75_04260 [Acidimicrobiales bacterium]|nr:hypothetical protein [Acidimicrobiales bacterium]